jgi:uncharacterized MAPEG superfamily protein
MTTASETAHSSDRASYRQQLRSQLELHKKAQQNKRNMFKAAMFGLFFIALALVTVTDGKLVGTAHAHSDSAISK